MFLFLLLDSFLLVGTGISGTVPEEVCELDFIEFEADCFGDDPPVTCPCCTECDPQAMDTFEVAYDNGQPMTKDDDNNIMRPSSP